MTRAYREKLCLECTPFYHCICRCVRRDDYVQLVDWTGRAIRDDKRGYIPNHLAEILVRLKIDPNNWLGMDKIETGFHQAIGCKLQLHICGQSLGRSWMKGVGSVRELFFE